MKSGIRANEVKPLAGPLEYRTDVSLPRKEGIVNLKTAKRDTSVMERKKYVVPAPEVTGDTDIFELPETYRRKDTYDFGLNRRVGSVEAYVEGERIKIREELSSTEIRIWSIPAIGEEVVFNYTPYSNTGGYAKHQIKIVAVTTDHILTRDEVLLGSVVFQNNLPIDVTLPTLTEVDNGICVPFMRSGWGEVTLLPSGGAAINGLPSYDIDLPWVSFELMWDYQNSNWIPFF